MSKPMLAITFVALLASGCAQGVVDPEAVSSSQGWRGERGRTSLVPEIPSALAMAASSDGLVLLRAVSSEIVATTPTRFPVEDLAYDPWRDRWIAVEYDDASANQVSVWRTTIVRGERIALSLESVIETAGYCRVAATRAGAVIFEDDGLHQRWMITADDLGAIRTTLAAAAPTSLVVRESESVSRLLSLVLRDQKDDPVVAWSTREIDQHGLLLVAEAELPAWSKHLSPPRMAAATLRSNVVAQMQHPKLQLAVVDDNGQPLTDGIEMMQDYDSVVEDLAVDSLTNTAYVLLSGSNHLKVVHLQAPFESDTVPVSGIVSPGSFWSIGRMLALDEPSGTLLLATNERVVAYQAPSVPGRKPSRISSWNGEGLRWPIVMSSRTEP